MNKNYILKTLLIVTFCALVSCNNTNKQEIVGKVNEPSVPTNIISVAQAIKMHDEYVTRIIPLIEKDKLQNENETYQATQYLYLNLDSLKQYIAFLDKVQEKNSKKISGLRLYFAAYPNAEDTKKAGFAAEYPGRETMFMAPTMQVARTELSKQYNVLEHIPFYIRPSGNDKYVGEFMEIEALLCKPDNRQIKTKSATARKSSLSGVITETSLIGNKMPQCPPPA